MTSRWHLESITTLFMLATALLTLAGPAHAKRVAVLEFSGDGSLVAADLQFLAEKVRSAALKFLDNDEWKVITRENMLVMLDANAEDLAECVGECEVETGRLIGANMVVAGSARIFGTRYTAIIRSYDTNSGELVGSEEVTAQDLDGLWDELMDASRRLFGGEEPSSTDMVSSTPSSPSVSPTVSSVAPPAPASPTIKFISLNSYKAGNTGASWTTVRPMLYRSPEAARVLDRGKAALGFGVFFTVWGTGALATGIGVCVKGDMDSWVYAVTLGMGGVYYIIGFSLLGTEGARRKKAIHHYNNDLRSGFLSEADRAPTPRLSLVLAPVSVLTLEF